MNQSEASFENYSGTVARSADQSSQSVEKNFRLNFSVISGWALVAPSCFALQVPYVRGSMLQRDVLSSEGGGGGGGGGGGLNRWSTCSRWWTAGTSRSGCLFTTDTRFLSVLDHHLTDYHQNQTHCYSCCIRIPSVTQTAHAMCSCYINLSECLLPGPRTELPGPVPGQARVWLRHWGSVGDLLLRTTCDRWMALKVPTVLSGWWWYHTGARGWSKAFCKLFLRYSGTYTVLQSVSASNGAAAFDRKRAT